MQQGSHTAIAFIAVHILRQFAARQSHLIASWSYVTKHGLLQSEAIRVHKPAVAGQDIEHTSVFTGVIKIKRVSMRNWDGGFTLCA